MKTWLKAACIGLLLYVMVFSLGVPLIPGGLNVDTEELIPGNNSFTFIGYNSHFLDEKSNLSVLILSGTATYCGVIDRIDDNNHVTVSVNLPDTLPSASIRFMANNKTDGTISVSKAMNTSRFTIVDGYQNGSCEIAVETNEHAGFGFPFQNKIYEGIRNLMFHVPMWFTMFFLMIMSFVYALRYLRMGENHDMATLEKKLMYDRKSADYAHVGVIFSLLGLLTGSMWARFTWGDWWTIDDPQLNGAMVVFLAYCAYFVFRATVPDAERKARLSGIFNIFAFVIMVVLLMIMPRFYDSLHPGKGGNPGFNAYDIDSSLRLVFYPAVLGWILLGYWIYTVKHRISNLQWTDSTSEK